MGSKYSKLEKTIKQYEKERQYSTKVAGAREDQLRDMVIKLSDIMHEMVLDFEREQKKIKEHNTLMMKRISEMAIRNNEDIRLTNERFDQRFMSLNRHDEYGLSNEDIDDLVQNLLARGSRERRGIDDEQFQSINISHLDLAPMIRNQSNTHTDLIPAKYQNEILLTKIWVPITILFMLTWIGIWKLFKKMNKIKGQSTRKVFFL